MAARKRRALEALPDEEESGDQEFADDLESESGSTHDRRALDLDSSVPPPVVDATKITFDTRLINPFLTCKLCNGYFRDAHTIKECLHTFCKICIFKHFHETKACPTCKQVLTPDPTQRIAADPQMKQLVAKIFPDLTKKDQEAEEAFYASRGIGKEDRNPQPPPPPPPRREASKKAKETPLPVVAATPPSSNTLVTFDLSLDERDPKLCDGLVRLDKPLVTTSAQITIGQLKKFILLRQSDSGMSVQDLDLLFHDTVLGSEHTLEFVLKTRGFRGDVPVFHFRRRKPPPVLL